MPEDVITEDTATAEDTPTNLCEECVWFTKKYRGQDCQERKKIVADSPACKEFELEPSKMQWEQFRSDPLVAMAIERVEKEMAFRLDDSLHRELDTYFVASLPTATGEKRSLPTRLSRDSDFEVVIGTLEDIQAKRDRVTQILLSLQSFRARITDLFEIIEGHLYKRKEIQELKSEYMRTAVVHSIVPELQQRISNVKVLIDKCDLIVRNLDKTYYTIATMLEAARFYMRMKPQNLTRNN